MGYPFCLTQMALENGWKETESGKRGGPHVAMLWKRLESACLDCACDTVRGTKTWICSKTRKSMSSPWL